LADPDRTGGATGHFGHLLGGIAVDDAEEQEVPVGRGELVQRRVQARAEDGSDALRGQKLLIRKGLRLVAAPAPVDIHRGAVGYASHERVERGPRLAPVPGQASVKPKESV
jgi:hypothetical protein